ncbi:hypothetical protein CCP3SC1AL1_1560011 [Gammaproteobacteria bacterium]
MNNVMKRTIKILNLQKIKDSEFELGDTNIIIGPNMSGKTTLSQAIQSIFLQKGFIKNPVSHGEKDGLVEYTGKDISGNSIIVKWQFNNEENKFTVAQIINEKVKIISDPKQIIGLLGNYFPLTAKDFWEKCKYAEGRKEIIDKYFISVFDNKEKERLNFINQQLTNKKNKESSNNLYHQRTEINRQISINEVVVNSYSLSDEEIDILSGETIEIKIPEDIDLDQLNTAILTASSIQMTLSPIRDKIMQYNKANKDLEVYKGRLISLEKKINELKQEKQSILSNGKLPSGLKIEEDSFTYNNMIFDETTVSEAETWLIIINLMCQICSAQLLTIGSWSEFDSISKEKIIKLAKQYNKFIIATEVNDDTDQVEIKIIN